VNRVKTALLALIALTVPGTGCRMFTVRGFTDRYWHDPSGGSGQGCGLLFDHEYRRKPAYYALRAGIDQTE
jgi:hypothetical protein